jgi:hypothetical protein
VKPTFQGELMLAGWRDTHNGGATVTFWLPDAAELDVFRGLTVKKGNTAGHRFMAVLVEIQDDEQPSAETDAVIVEAAQDALKGGNLSRFAARLCADIEFQDWFLEMHGQTEALKKPVPVREKIAAEIMRGICSVDSRAQLDHDARAAEMFHGIRKQWNRFCQGEAGNCA